MTHPLDCRCDECKVKAVRLACSMIDDALETLSLDWKDEDAIAIALSQCHRVPKPIAAFCVRFATGLEEGDDSPTLYRHKDTTEVFRLISVSSYDGKATARLAGINIKMTLDVPDHRLATDYKLIKIGKPGSRWHNHHTGQEVVLVRLSRHGVTVKGLKRGQEVERCIDFGEWGAHYDELCQPQSMNGVEVLVDGTLVGTLKDLKETHSRQGVPCHELELAGLEWHGDDLHLTTKEGKSFRLIKATVVDQTTNFGEDEHGDVRDEKGGVVMHVEKLGLKDP